MVGALADPPRHPLDEVADDVACQPSLARGLGVPAVRAYSFDPSGEVGGDASEGLCLLHRSIMARSLGHRLEPAAVDGRQSHGGQDCYIHPNALRWLATTSSTSRRSAVVNGSWACSL